MMCVVHYTHFTFQKFKLFLSLHMCAILDGDLSVIRIPTVNSRYHSPWNMTLHGISVCCCLFLFVICVAMGLTFEWKVTPCLFCIKDIEWLWNLIQLKALMLQIRSGSKFTFLNQKMKTPKPLFELISYGMIGELSMNKLKTL